MSSTQGVRDSVSKAYAKAVSGQSQGGCCGPVPKGVVVKVAGYTPEELRELPDEAVVNSFGCGNPLAFSEVKEGDVVLDLGAGAGIDVLLAARRIGSRGRAIGVDMTDAMLEKARATIAASGLENAEMRKGNIEDLPVESDSVDWVISNCVINLSPEKEKVFAEIFRVLKPGGRMLVSDIVAENLPSQVLESAALYSTCIAGAISEKAYCEGLQGTGLVDVEVRGRIEYDPVQIHGLIESDLEVAQASPDAAADGSNIAETARELAAQCENKVWSVKVFARKPR